MLGPFLVSQWTLVLIGGGVIVRYLCNRGFVGFLGWLGIESFARGLFDLGVLIFDASVRQRFLARRELFRVVTLFGGVIQVGESFGLGVVAVVRRRFLLSWLGRGVLWRFPGLVGRRNLVGVLVAGAGLAGFGITGLGG
jgi:hypothetical protein